MNILKHKNSKKGLTLVEILISIAILTFLFLFGLSAFRVFSGKEALSTEAKKITTAIEEARSKTLSSEGGERFGVYLLTNGIVVFQYPYVEGGLNNKNVSLERGVSISSYLLTGGGNQILFKKISGETDNNGSITLVSSRESKQIILEKTGLSYIQE